jgi:hypothetical protein
MLITSLRVKNNKAAYKEVTGAEIIEKTLPPALALTMTLKALTVYAAGDVGKAFQPIIDTIKQLADPIAYGFVIKGFIEIIAGKAEAGKKTISGAIAGYIGVQWLPWLFGLVKGIGQP